MVILEESTKIDIKSWSRDLLVTSRCLNVFPTPVKKLAAFSDLQVSGEDLSHIRPIYLDKDDSSIKNLFGRLRGLLVREAKLIYLDRSCCEERQRFTLLHEIGHNLPWQVAASTINADDDYTLSQETKEQFELEASYFASETMFQGDNFSLLAQNEPLSIETPLKIAPIFGASKHAALRRYVEYSPSKCALLVMKEPKGCCVSLRDLFHSKSFLSSIGKLPFPDIIDAFQYPFVDLYTNSRKSGKGRFRMPINGNFIILNYEYFNNTYNGFVFIYP